MGDGRSRSTTRRYRGRSVGVVAALLAAGLVSGVAVPTGALGAAQPDHRRPPWATSQDPCHNPPVRGFGFDRYGGWKGLHHRPTGRFTVGRAGHRWSLFTPLGNAFFANGATGIGPIGDYVGNTSQSPYHDAIMARYGSEAAWSDATFARLCALGMRTMGGWVSVEDVDLFAGRLAYTVNVDVYASLPEVPTAPWSIKPRRDVFVADARDRARAAVAANPLVARCADDPWCIGVFVENEQPYAPTLTAGGSHLDVYLSQPAGSPGKVALQEFFARRYRGDLDRFDATWGTDLATWSDLQNLSALGDCPPIAGYLDDLCALDEPRGRLDDRIAFEAAVAGRVARLAEAVLDEIDPAMLDLGPRLVVAPYPPQLLRAISRPADVVSVNNYDIEAVADLLLGEEVKAKMEALGMLSFDPFTRLRQVAAITHKPVWVSEWFYRTARPSVPSVPPLLPERPDPDSRAEAAAVYLDELLGMPFVVGESWFQWQDQPIEGRRDGENQLIGIVDIDDELVQPMSQRLADLYARIVDRRFVVHHRRR